MVWRRGGCVCANKLPWPARDKRPPPRSPLSMWQSREEDREPAHADVGGTLVSAGLGDRPGEPTAARERRRLHGDSQGRQTTGRWGDEGIVSCHHNPCFFFTRPPCACVRACVPRGATVRCVKACWSMSPCRAGNPCGSEPKRNTMVHGRGGGSTGDIGAVLGMGIGEHGWHGMAWEWRLPETRHIHHTNHNDECPRMPVDNCSK